MRGAARAVLVMAPGGGELERALGSDRLAHLSAALVAAAQKWARAVAPDAIHHAQAGEPLADAITRVFGVHDGPLLVVWPLLPQLRCEHALAALDDFEAGCDLVLGPLIDGGLYLLGLARPVSALLSIPEATWQEPDAMAIGLAAARDSGIEVGLLRAERGVRRPGDLRAALADPLLPEGIRRILKRAG
jgi:glycosyltransferase A (GT-A) superfamily protein (DUF2064 family)